MDSDPSISDFIFITVLLFVAFGTSIFFSIIKIIFSSIDKDALPIDDKKLRFFAAKIEEILLDKAKLIATVSFGKSLANTSFAILAFYLVYLIFPHFPLAYTLIITILSVAIFLSIFAYAIPRAIALTFHNRFIALTFGLYILFKTLFSVISGLIVAINTLMLKMLHFDGKYSFLSEDEKTRLHDATDNGDALDKHEQKMIKRIFELGETTVKEIMVPRVDIQALDINTDYQTVLATIREVGHSRIPIYKENIDSIIGILYAKDILSWIGENPDAPWHLKSLLKEPQFVPINKKIDDLMQELKKNHVHIAIVVDEYGGTAGIVTMEDILEEIVGEIQDEFDAEEESVLKVSDNIYHVEPHIELDDLGEKLNIPFSLDEVEYNTLGGLFYHEYGDVPVENTEFEFNGLRLKIVEMDNQRIEKVELEILHQNNDSSDQED